MFCRAGNKVHGCGRPNLKEENIFDIVHYRNNCEGFNSGHNAALVFRLTKVLGDMICVARCR